MELTLEECGLAQHFKFTYVAARLDEMTATLSDGAKAVVLFAGDSSNKKAVLKVLRDNGVKLIVLRYAGRTTMDEMTANQYGIKVKQVVSNRASMAVAEFVVSLILGLQRQMVLLAARCRSGILHTLSSNQQPVLTQRTVGVIGTDKVGCQVVRILRRIGCKVLAFDVIEAAQVRADGAKYVTFDRLLEQSDIISLHVPPAPKVKHIINEAELSRCKHGVHIINTAYLNLINLEALVEALETGRVGGFAADLFDANTVPMFRPCDEGTTTRREGNLHLANLKQMPNVIITAHQSTVTRKAQKETSLSIANILTQFYDIDMSSTQGSATSTS